MTMTANGASLNAPGNPQRADQVSHSRSSAKSDRTPTGSIPTSFAPVTQQRFGTSTANGYRGPGYANLDASLFKSFRIKSRVDGQFRIEALNVTNTPHFANPGTNVNAEDFGRVTFTANPGPRVRRAQHPARAAGDASSIDVEPGRTGRANRRG